MKIKILLFLSILFFAACRGEKPRTVGTDLINIMPTDANSKEAKEMARITFEKTEYDFGKIIEGDAVTFTYEFENTGKSDLVISDVVPGCGCTTAKDWSKKPYRPGEKGKITVTFESEGRAGTTNKEIDVITNAYPAVAELKLIGEVVGPEIK